MASISKDGETADHATQLADSSSFVGSDMFDEDFVFTDNDEVWNEQPGQKAYENQDQDDGMNDLANNLNTFASIGLDRHLLGNQYDGNRQAPGSFSDPFLNYNKPTGMSIAPRNLHVNNNENDNRAGDDHYEQFFEEILDSGITKEDNAMQEQSAFMELGAQADEVNGTPDGSAPQSVSDHSQPPFQVNAELEDVFADNEQFGMLQFQQQLRVTQLQTGPFNLREPPQFARNIPRQSKPVKEAGFINPEPRNFNTADMAEPSTIAQASPIGFSARRREHVAKRGKTNKKSNPTPEQAIDKGGKDGRVNKRPRVTLGANTPQGGQRGASQFNQTPSLGKVPEQLVLRSDPAGTPGGKVFGAQPQNTNHVTSILRPQPRMANQQIAVPRKPSLEQPGMGMFELQGNHSPAPQNLNPFSNQPFGPPLRLDAIGRNPVFNPDRLQGPPSVIVGPQVAPAIPSPITPSLRFPFEVFKYPTGEHYAQYLGPQVIKVLLENLYKDVGSTIYRIS
ncbi:hypothetical protein BKA64DRAFT_458604 [Cadophora sp. MPI-SDFR-AT-0126]|nr:hypothetical protein BKA64DRAFT_458604 [Leotiomycetes sp. MPI-SDFR-AT-0126]